MKAMIGPAALAALALAASGCGGGGDDKSSTSSANDVTTSSAPSTPSSGGGQALSVGETEYKLNPSTLRVAKPGTVTITVANNGSTVHALEVEGAGEEAKTGAIQPGSRKTLTVKVTKPGGLEMYCPIDGHRKMGMQGTVLVGAGAAGGTERQGKPGKGGGSAPKSTKRGSSGTGSYGY